MRTQLSIYPNTELERNWLGLAYALITLLVHSTFYFPDMTRRTVKVGVRYSYNYWRTIYISENDCSHYFVKKNAFYIGYRKNCVSRIFRTFLTSAYPLYFITGVSSSIHTDTEVYREKQ
jgi:hypothetical protein